MLRVDETGAVAVANLSLQRNSVQVYDYEVRAGEPVSHTETGTIVIVREHPHDEIADIRAISEANYDFGVDVFDDADMAELRKKTDYATFDIPLEAVKALLRRRIEFWRSTLCES